jgi:hypothetical protein
MTSLGRVYEFLLKIHGDAKRARAGFVSFLWDSFWKKQNCGSRKDRSVNASRAATNAVLGAG